MACTSHACQHTLPQTEDTQPTPITQGFPVLTIPTSPPGQTGSTSYASRARGRGSPSPPFFIPCGSWGLGLPLSSRPNPRAKHTRNSSPPQLPPPPAGRALWPLLQLPPVFLPWGCSAGYQPGALALLEPKPCPGPSSCLVLSSLCPTLLPPLP